MHSFFGWADFHSKNGNIPNKLFQSSAAPSNLNDWVGLEGAVPIRNIHLRKLLKIGYLTPNARRSALRTDIREQILREAGSSEGGGDFYAPFWYDAKGHVFGTVNLPDAVEERIATNWRRAALYRQLRDGFLLWWNERRRWTNEPFEPGPSLKTHYDIPGLAATVKVDSILSVRDGLAVDHYIYPYFAPDPVLDDEAARLGLWLLGQALPDVPLDEIRILDVLRGRTFSIDRHPLQGDEEQRFQQMYEGLLREHAELQREYA